MRHRHTILARHLGTIRYDTTRPRTTDAARHDTARHTSTHDATRQGRQNKTHGSECSLIHSRAPGLDKTRHDTTHPARHARQQQGGTQHATGPTRHDTATQGQCSFPLSSRHEHATEPTERTAHTTAVLNGAVRHDTKLHCTMPIRAVYDARIQQTGTATSRGTAASTRSTEQSKVQRGRRATPCYVIRQGRTQHNTNGPARRNTRQTLRQGLAWQRSDSGGSSARCDLQVGKNLQSSL